MFFVAPSSADCITSMAGFDLRQAQGSGAMITLMIVHVANKLARFGKVVPETWRETQRLRRYNLLSGCRHRLSTREQEW